MSKKSVLITIKTLPTLVIEKTNKGEIKVIQLSSGRNATYHDNGHSHIFDPNYIGPWKQELYEIGLKDNRKENQIPPKSYAKRLSELFGSCWQSVPIPKIEEPIFFISFGLETTEWKERYKKMDKIELLSDFDQKLAHIYLSKDVPQDNDIMPIITIGHPKVFIKIGGDPTETGQLTFKADLK